MSTTTLGLDGTPVAPAGTAPAMSPRARTWMWLGAAVMALAAALTQFAQPVPVAKPGLLADALPKEFGGWRVDPETTPVAPTPDVQQNLDRIYDEIVSRTYIDRAGRRVMLILAYGGDQSDSMKAHRQEVCYTAQGFQVSNVHNDTLKLADGRLSPLVRMHAVKGNRSEPVSYWFTMGEYVVLGRLERLIAQVRYGLAGEMPDGMLVRVSTVDADPKTGFAAQDDFMRALLAALPAQTQRRFGVVQVR
jgi:EpsI family protein